MTTALRVSERQSDRAAIEVRNKQRIMAPLSGRHSGRVAVMFLASTVNVNQEVQRTKTHHAEARFGALHLLIFLPFWLQILPPLKQLVVRPVNDVQFGETYILLN